MAGQRVAFLLLSLLAAAAGSDASLPQAGLRGTSVVEVKSSQQELKSLAAEVKSLAAEVKALKREAKSPLAEAKSLGQDGTPAAEVKSSGQDATKVAETPAVEARSSEQDACSGQLLSKIGADAQDCFAACPQACAPLAAAAGAWVAGYNPAYAVCGAQEDFHCFFQHPKECARLLEAGDSLMETTLPRSEAELTASCQRAPDDAVLDADEVGAVKADAPEQASTASEAQEEVGEVEAQAEWTTVCRSRHIGWFCFGRTRVRCCQRSFGMTQCGTMTNWHGCFR